MAYVLDPRPKNERPARLPLEKTLKDGTPVRLDTVAEAHVEEMRRIFNAIVLDGATYPQERALDDAAFRAYYLSHDAFCVTHGETGVVMAAVYIKPNFPGRCAHICNGGFIVDAKCRGMGLGSFMADAYLLLARDLGYRASMFNLVFVDNTAGVNLWRKKGFSELGRVPNAGRKKDGSYVDAIQFYYDLTTDVTTDTPQS